MTASDEEVLAHVNKIAAQEDADFLFINSAFYPSLHGSVCEALDDRKAFRSKAYIILVTEGGLAEVAYRICRRLQDRYDELIVVVPGWCKSAGTLFCVGASKIIFGMQGELGPIDVQLRRPDEIGERDSGLAVDSAFDAVQHASFKIFEQYMLGVKRKSYGAVTFKTAADIAAQVTIGLTQPILAQLDPIKVGEIHRSVRIAEEYARRLNMIAGNARTDLPINPIQMLLRGYPSHEFVIDLLEARMLFRHVELATGELAELITMLGDDAVQPIDEDQTAGGIVEFLNEEADHEPEEQADGENGGADHEGSDPPSAAESRDGNVASLDREGLSRAVPERSEPSVHPGSGPEDSSRESDEAA